VKEVVWLESIINNTLSSPVRYGVGSGDQQVSCFFTSIH